MDIIILELFNQDNTCKISFHKGKYGNYIFSIYDFINFVSNKGIYDEYATKVYSNLGKLTNNFVTYCLPNENNIFTIYMDIIDLIKLLSILPDDMSKKYRKLSNHTILLVTEDDNSLMDTIKIEEQNDLFIQQMFGLNLDNENDIILSGKLGTLRIPKRFL